MAICRLLRPKKKPLVLIGHSLGGLLIKEALIRIVDSDSESSLIDLVCGFVLFGVPNSGMDIESLVPMVNDQPNRSLLESLSDMNSQILRLQNRNFFRVLKQTTFKMFCFYETRLSPTAAKVGIFTVEGISPNSATESSHWTI
jgi:surfactin synthase thioesterase subunit